MSTTERKKSVARLKTKDKPGMSNKGKYASVEEASLAKMEAAKEFIANLDMALFKKNGPIE
ncbi:hypothetical protein [Spirosoma foliorum]|uniref:Uncharacterized protein n=1 Tax=Spirosoma foliorum TaxID=2710596 RepID=A0A7G5GTB7_9BACT|nr:hypothetical protein [Spirosoma foliorum]QMW02109.1 hypothetical protein H3H32_29930 [Spirosoma foliorum]